MKGKIDVRFALPQVGRIRSRIENAPVELSSDIRKELQKVAVEVLNEANLNIRNKMIAYVAGRTDLVFKNDVHKKQVLAPMSGIFDSVFAVDADALNAIVGDDAPKAPKAEKPAEKPAAETKAAPAAKTTAPKAPKAAPKAKATPVAPEAEEEDVTEDFEDEAEVDETAGEEEFED